ncbi:MAG: HipA domain-containing protein [Lachnospiraceae bacterium]|nr:HipA domain-containing protein [Lachnospiraceae bacterium]
MPKIELSNDMLETLVIQNTKNGASVTGVQKKLSLNIDTGKDGIRLTLVNCPAGYILKPQVEEFECLPEAEHLVMCMADATGIATVPHALIWCEDELAYITKRVDRIYASPKIKKLAMEDFCQLDLRLTADKYKGSYERCSKIVREYSDKPGIDMAELFMRLVFSFVTGNSDMHLKNFSLIEGTDSGRYVLSPAYDLLPVNVIMPEDKEEYALSMNGKKQNIRRKDFIVFAEGCDMPRTSAEKMIAKVLSMEAVYINMCKESLLSEHLKSELIELIKKRCEKLL